MPTATQKLAVGHDTPSRVGATEVVVSPAGFGVACRCQLAPSHRSASVTSIPEVLTSVPTAVQAVAAEQETDSMVPPVSVAFTEFAIVQVASVDACAPTALAPIKITASGAASIAFLRQLATVKCLRQLIVSPALFTSPRHKNRHLRSIRYRCNQVRERVDK